MIWCRRRSRTQLALAVLAIVLAAPVAVAQHAGAHSGLMSLGELQRLAIATDPRAAQVDLLKEQSVRRLEGIDREWLPSVALGARGQYQSEVAALTAPLPPNIAIPRPSFDSYDAYLSVNAPVLDPSRSARRRVEERRLSEAGARVRGAQFPLRLAVNDAFYSALIAQAQAEEIETGLVQLAEQLRVTGERVRQGAALPGAAMALEAEWLRRRQARAGLEAARDAALDVLGELTGRAIPSVALLEVPDLHEAVRTARAVMDTIRARPEFAHLDRQRELLEAESALVGTGSRPTVSGFARTGYGRPGLNPLATSFTGYWLVGVQLSWVPWDWGARDRQREVLSTQNRVIATEVLELDGWMRRSVTGDLHTMDRLLGMLAEDDRITVLREATLAEARLRFAEGVIGSAEYVAAEGELLSARLNRVIHRMELSQAQAHFLTTLGLELR